MLLFVYLLAFSDKLVLILFAIIIIFDCNRCCCCAVAISNSIVILHFFCYVPFYPKYLAHNFSIDWKDVREKYRIQQENVRFIECKPDVNKNTLNWCSQRDANKDNSNERHASFSSDRVVGAMMLKIFDVCAMCIRVLENELHGKQRIRRTNIVDYMSMYLFDKEMERGGE